MQSHSWICAWFCCTLVSTLHELWICVFYLAIFFKVASVALGLYYGCPSASAATLKDIGEIIVHYTQQSTTHVHVSSKAQFANTLDSWWTWWKIIALQRCHNGRDHQPHDCLLNCLFRCRSKKTSKLPVTGLCAGNFGTLSWSKESQTATEKP